MHEAAGQPAQCTSCGHTQPNPSSAKLVKCKGCGTFFSSGETARTSAERTPEGNTDGIESAKGTCTHCGKVQANVYGEKMVKCAECDRFFPAESKEPESEPEDRAVTCTHCGRVQENSEGVKFMQCAHCNKYFPTHRNQAIKQKCMMCGASDASMVTDFQNNWINHARWKYYAPANDPLAKRMIVPAHIRSELETTLGIYKTFHCNQCGYEW